MTYDELLVQIDRIMNHEDWVLKKKYFKALRAVVELHKPNLHGDECTHCGWECGGKLVSYPCPTIEVIENELSK